MGSSSPHAVARYLQLALTPAERLRLERAAAYDHLTGPRWAKQVILRAVDVRLARSRRFPGTVLDMITEHEKEELP